MTVRTALAVIVGIYAVALPIAAITSCGKGDNHARRPLAIATRPVPASPVDPALPAPVLVGTPKADKAHPEALQATGTVLAVAEPELPPPTPYSPALAQPCGPRVPTQEDIDRVVWATLYFDDMGWATGHILELEWCESTRCDNLIGLAGEQGRFQYLPSTWVRFQHEWMAVRSDPPPVDPFNAWDATLMTAFAISQGHGHEWTCWRW